MTYNLSFEEFNYAIYAILTAIAKQQKCNGLKIEFIIPAFLCQIDFGQPPLSREMI
jgi:hypothetical protein